VYIVTSYIPEYFINTIAHSKTYKLAIRKENLRQAFQILIYSHQHCSCFHRYAYFDTADRFSVTGNETVCSAKILKTPLFVMCNSQWYSYYISWFLCVRNVLTVSAPFRYVCHLVEMSTSTMYILASSSSLHAVLRKKRFLSGAWCIFCEQSISFVVGADIC